MRQHPFVFLTGCDEDNKPVATQIPVFIDQKGEQIFLTGHMMKETDHHKAFLQNPHALAVFTGAHTYVSASWYSNPLTASTWNYMSVHAKGILRFMDEESLLKILQRTTNHFENDPASPSLFEKLPGEYVQRLVKAIAGFEIEVLEIDHVFKLSQDRDEKSYHNIIEKLGHKDPGAKKIAEEMAPRASRLFDNMKQGQNDSLEP